MNAIDIFTQEGTSLEGGTSFLGGQKGEKTETSLFDTILKSSIDSSKNLGFVPEKTIQTGAETVANNMENITANLSSGSLLDRLIVEAKDLILENKVINPEENSNLVDTKPEKQNFIETLNSALLDKNIESNIDVESGISSEAPKDKDVKVENSIVKNDTTTSLLDKLISDVKSEISANPKLEENVENKDVKVDEKPKNDIVKNDIVKNDTTTSLLDKLISDVKSEISVNSKLEENVENKDIKVDEKPKNDIVKNDTATSLLDKLISDAKKIIVEDKNSLQDQKNVKTIETTISTPKDDILIANVLEDNIVIEEESSITKPTIMANNEIIALNKENNLKNIDIKEIKVADNPKSLMDALIQNSMKKQEDFAIKNPDLTNNIVQQKEVVSNIYLGEQKNQLNTQLNFNKAEAINLLKEGASLEDIQKSATILELGLDDVELEKKNSLDEIINKSNLKDLNDKRQILDTLLNEKNIRSVDVRNLITKSVEASAALMENSLNIEEDKVINVNSPLSFNIQSKIIGAKQQMSQMMSDIARQMYENYRPPVTVFRVNLHPEHLGSISIMMKSDKNSDLTISMSVSSQATLEALIENQNLLRNSLNKSFDENVKFNLDFSQGEQNQDGKHKEKQEEQNNQDEHIDTNTILKLQEENKEIDDKFDYM